MIWPLFKILGPKFVKFFVGILVQMMTPKGHFEINWPLKVSKSWLPLNPFPIIKVTTYYMADGTLRICSTFSQARLRRCFHLHVWVALLILWWLETENKCTYLILFDRDILLVIISNDISKSSYNAGQCWSRVSFCDFPTIKLFSYWSSDKNRISIKHT